MVLIEKATRGMTMNDSKIETGELSPEELENVSGGNPVSPSSGAGVSRPYGPADQHGSDKALPLGVGPFSGFAQGAAGGAGKPPD
jgi:hypothetical protein